MTVRELIQQLWNCDQDALVLVDQESFWPYARATRVRVVKVREEGDGYVDDDSGIPAVRLMGD